MDRSEFEAWETRIRARADRIVGQRLEAPEHRRVQDTACPEVGRQAVVEQVHQAGLRPEPFERGLDRHDRMFQGVDQGNAHARHFGRGAAAVNLPYRRASQTFTRLSKPP